jgi:uncharacterized protein
MHLPLLASLTVGSALDDVGRSLREGFFMLWDTLWALVLGFTLSGAIQSFVPGEVLESRLGDHSPVSVGRASFYGAVSSSCSYAAAATARSLFRNGADFVASMVFMFASSNLVIELGVVLAVLIGWQFLAAEFIGGSIMIVLLVVGGALWFRGRALADGRERAASAGHHHHHHGPDDSVSSRLPWTTRLRSLAGWSDAAGYTMSDLTMLRRELVVGFGVAGFLAVLVPVHVWNSLFLPGHGVLTTLENAAVGPFVAIISFVCSIGNVPLAAALWKGGISFGGVVSFIFADLITFPLLLVYRRQYGTRLALRMLLVFWPVMSLAGLLTGELFRLIGWIPGSRPSVIASEVFQWNYTTVLNIVALVSFGVLYWLYRNRARFATSSPDEKDPGPDRSTAASSAIPSRRR